MKRVVNNLLVYLFVSVLTSCDVPVELNRDNPLDPFSPRYKLIPPKDLQVRQLGQIVRVMWRDQSDTEEGYLVKRKKDNATYQTIAALPPNSITFIDTVDAYGTYSYQVQAFMGDLYSDSLESAKLWVDSWSPAPDLPRQIIEFSKNSFLLPNGRVFLNCIDTFLFDPVMITWEKLASGTRGYSVLRLTPNGKPISAILFFLETVAILSIDYFDFDENRWLCLPRIGIPNQYRSTRFFKRADLLEILDENTMLIFYVDATILFQMSDYSTVYWEGFNHKRYDADIVRLKNGSILAAGGYSFESDSFHEKINSCEIFDVQTQKWQMVSPMSLPRAGENQFSILLDDGRVLEVGGTNTDIVEIYDPDADQWTELLNVGSELGFAVKLKSGKVLLVYRDRSLIFDHRTDQFTETDRFPFEIIPSPVNPVVLENGYVMVFGDGSQKCLVYVSPED